MTPAAEATRERIAAALEGIPHRTLEPRDRMPCVQVEREALRETLERLRDRASFEAVTLVTAIDLLPNEPRFEVVHQLWSASHTDRVRIKTRVRGDDPVVPTCVDLWPGAAFMEREVFDLFGVVFEGHEGLKRLLMPEEFEHHPLRKDFPHAGIEPDKLYRLWDAERRGLRSAEELGGGDVDQRIRRTR